jgi:histone-lysine N-methyltransferase SETD3
MDIKSLVGGGPRIPEAAGGGGADSAAPLSRPGALSLHRSESVHRTDDGEAGVSPASDMPEDRLKFHHPKVLSEQKSLEDSNAACFDAFVKWLLDNGAKFPGLYFKCYGNDQRGVHCKEDIPPNKRIMYVPLRCLITDQVARRTPTGQKLLGIEKRLSAPNHNQIIVFMLEDMRNEKSFFKPYYDILPKDVTNFPVFWTEKEVRYLQGSNLPEEIVQRRKKIRSDYEIIGDLLPDFFEHVTFDKFLWCRTIVGSRNFTITIDGSKRTSMVPQADMLNHYRPRETSWTFENSCRCFTITSLKTLSAGQQVMDSYGKKCNSKFLLHYGFAVERNREASGECLNKVCVKMQMKDTDTCLRDKLFLVPRVKKFPVNMTYTSKDNQAALAFVRVVVAADRLQVQSLTDTHTVRLDDNNEMAAVRAIADQLAERLKGYPTTYQEDLRKMKSGTLVPFTNERNALIVMMGEKEIAHMWIQAADEIEKLVKAGVKSGEHKTHTMLDKYAGKDDDVSKFILAFFKTNRRLNFRRTA